MSQAWKNAERQAAKYLHGIRRSRVAYSEKIEDVIHSDLAIEVKWGKQIPKWVASKRPMIVQNQSGCYVIVNTAQISHGWHPLGILWITSKKLKFIENAVKQALRYDKTKKKMPLVVLKPKGYRGLIFVMKIWDWSRFRKHVTA